jgi:hypothetical protein
MTTVWGSAGPNCHRWRGTGRDWILVLPRVEKNCTRLDIVVWPSLLAALSFQAGCCASNLIPLGKNVACKSIRWSYNPRGSIACLMERFAAVFQEAFSNQGSLQHCEGSCIIGCGDGKLLLEWIRRDNFPQWQCLDATNYARRDHRGCPGG